MRAQGKTHHKNMIYAADEVGAETIFLIIPSSADIYPETVPDNYTKASGERLYEAFTKIAESYGAKVIYPLDTMKKHKNDGVGYQLYQNTDSHWSTYGSYWGTYDMLNYIAKKYPAAKPRTLSEMKFYTKELCAGDFEGSVVHGIMGGAWLCSNLDELWRNEVSREALMNTVRLLDKKEEIIGLSGHLLAISRK